MIVKSIRKCAQPQFIGIPLNYWARSIVRYVPEFVEINTVR